MIILQRERKHVALISFLLDKTPISPLQFTECLSPIPLYASHHPYPERNLHERIQCLNSLPHQLKICALPVTEY
jgi:hypothetical protein